MKILELKNTDEQHSWIDKIRVCDWGAAKFLADLMEQDKFHEMLGNGSLLILADAEKLIAFCTLTQKDCIKDDSLFPWIGFVFTSPEYRGKRHSEKLVEYACEKARMQGFENVYIATDHIGLYEKYGFTYMENRIDIYGEESRVYCRKTGE